jgi:hypothetical protein
MRLKNENNKQQTTHQPRMDAPESDAPWAAKAKVGDSPQTSLARQFIRYVRIIKGSA